MEASMMYVYPPFWDKFDTPYEAKTLLLEEAIKLNYLEPEKIIENANKRLSYNNRVHYHLLDIIKDDQK